MPTEGCRGAKWHFQHKKAISCHANINFRQEVKIRCLGHQLKCERAQKLRQDDHDEDEQLKNKSN